MEHPGVYTVHRVAATETDTVSSPTESQFKAEIRQIVVECLDEVFRDYLAGILLDSSPSRKRQWYSTKDAYLLLDLDSPEQLLIKVREGVLRVGIEVRDNRKASSKVPRYQFHIEKCQERLQLPPCRRKNVLQYSGKNSSSHRRITHPP